VALIACDHPYPQPLHAKRPLTGAFATALILAPERGEHAIAALDVSITRASPNGVTPVAQPGLEALRTGVPAARCIPLLAALARKSAETIDLEYLAGALLTLRVIPCR
jgi:hypothetical protein